MSRQEITDMIEVATRHLRHLEGWERLCDDAYNRVHAHLTSVSSEMYDILHEREMTEMTRERRDELGERYIKLDQLQSELAKDEHVALTKFAEARAKVNEATAELKSLREQLEKLK